MRLALALMVLLAACDRASPPSERDAGEDGGAWVVVPGRRIGPLQVGMDRRALSRQGLPITLFDGSARHVMAGPFELRFNGVGRVERISLALSRAADGVRIDTSSVRASDGPERIIAVAPGCTPPVPVDGVATWRCAGGGLLVHRGEGSVVLSVAQPLDAGR